MSNKTLQLFPTYLNDFSCIGSDCEDNCCHSWNVLIDKDTYKKYNSLPPSPLKVKLDLQTKRLKKSNNDQAYGCMKLTDKGVCPFLEAGGLCEIHAKLGEDYLSATCKTYPRQSRIVNNIQEISLAMSCPEAARLTLLNANGLDYELRETSPKEFVLISSFNASDFNDYRSKLWDIRSFCITIMQTRRFTIEERISIIGIFLSNLKTKEHSQIDYLIETFEQLLKDDSLTDQFANLNHSPVFQLDVIVSLLQHQVSLGTSQEKFVDCMKELMSGLNFNDNDEINRTKLFEEFKKAETTIFMPFFAHHNYILENYFVDYIFQSCFPTDSLSLEEAYAILCTNYLLLKILLSGIGSYHGQLSIEQCVRVIYLFSRALRHNDALIQSLVKHLEQNSLLTFEQLIISILG